MCVCRFPPSTDFRLISLFSIFVASLFSYSLLIINEIIALKNCLPLLLFLLLSPRLLLPLPSASVTGFIRFLSWLLTLTSDTRPSVRTPTQGLENGELRFALARGVWEEGDTDEGKGVGKWGKRWSKLEKGVTEKQLAICKNKKLEKRTIRELSRKKRGKLIRERKGARQRKRK